MNVRSVPYYGILFMITFIFDRFTKTWALANCQERTAAHDLISFELTFNRGISWGWLHSSGATPFFLVSLATTALITVLALYTIKRWQQGHAIVGETLILSGALSNLIDRIMHPGVVDFIIVSAGPCTTPVFNVADICIVIGVGCMFIGGILRP